MTRVRAGAATDVGRRRKNNQDAHLVDPDERLFAVADGMGGYAGGEVASQTAIDALHQTFPAQPTAEGLESAVRDANRAVIERASSEPDLRQMGTTLSVAALVPADDEASDEVFAIAHVGDSRIYLLRDGELSQLTDDHTVSEEMKRSGQLTDAEALIDTRRHILTRVLGPRDNEAPDMQTIVPYAGDRLVLCSDGLYNEVPDSNIAKVLRTIVDPTDAARRLVDLANQAGGGDNITVVIVDVVDDDDRSAAASRELRDEHRLMTADERNAQLRRLAREPDDDDNDITRAPEAWSPRRAATDADVPELPNRRVTARVVLFLVLLLAVIGAALGTVGWYARGSYFVGLDEGEVAIFKGRPGGLLFFQPTIEERTDLTEAEVPDARIEDVTAGHEVASVDEARRYVTNLRRDRELTTTTTPTTAPPTAPIVTSTPTTAPA